MKNKKKNPVQIYTDEFSLELIKRYSEYKNAKVKMVDSVESSKRVQILLQSKLK